MHIRQDFLDIWKFFQKQNVRIRIPIMLIRIRIRNTSVVWCLCFDCGSPSFLPSFLPSFRNCLDMVTLYYDFFKRYAQGEVKR